MYWNEVTQGGFIGRDGVVRESGNGTKILSFSIGVSNPRRKERPTQWYNVTVFGKYGEALAPYVKTGGKVLVQGELEANEYTTKDGEVRKENVIIASKVQLIGSREDADSGDAPAPRAQAPAAENEAVPF